MERVKRTEVAGDVGGVVFYVVLPGDLADLTPRGHLAPLASCTEVSEMPHRVGLESDWVCSCLEELKVKSAVQFEEVGLTGIRSQLDDFLCLPGEGLVGLDVGHVVDRC